MSESPRQNPFPEALPGTTVIGAAIHWYPEAPSTNIYALECERDGTVFIAEHQTAGRGRHGKRWHSAEGLGLWFSIALAAPLRGVSFGAALAVRNALANKVAVDLRWPNDLCCASRKIGGILVEQRGNRIALGIGINVNHRPEDFPVYLRHRAGSLATATGYAWDRTEVLTQVLMHLDDMVIRMRQGGHEAIHDEWTKACNIIGCDIRRGAIVGRVTAIDGDGALLVMTGTGPRRLACGDITIVRPI